MALFDKPLDLITEDDLASLIENQVREGYQIEYKQAVAFKDKQDKLDFLAGVTSFANTVGGDFLIGITAASGVPSAIPGWAGIDVDQEKQRIENLLRDQVEPRVAFKIHEIRLRNGNAVVLIRVPWSWAQPHMVRMDQVNRFYYRHSAGKDIMNITQLRAAFALTTGLEEQIAAFCLRRLRECAQ
jgi:predicted HTH transcriptional regulator